MGKNIIEVKNIKTGEVLEFTGQNAVAKYLTNVWEINFIKNANKKICDCCGKEFTSNRANQRFCSGTCREEYVVVQRTKDTPLVAMGNKDKEKLVHKLVTMLAPYRTAK